MALGKSTVSMTLQMILFLMISRLNLFLLQKRKTEVLTLPAALAEVRQEGLDISEWIID